MVESRKLQGRETNMVRARVGTGLSIEGPGGGDCGWWKRYTFCGVGGDPVGLLKPH